MSMCDLQSESENELSFQSADDRPLTRLSGENESESSSSEIKFDISRQRCDVAGFEDSQSYEIERAIVLF